MMMYNTMNTLDLNGLEETSDIDFENISSNGIYMIKLSGCDIRNFDFTEKFTKTVAIDLSHAKNFTNFDFLLSLNRLYIIDLSYTNVCDISKLKQIENLGSINLYGTNVSDISVFKEIGKLMSININNTKIKLYKNITSDEIEHYNTEMIESLCNPIYINLSFHEAIDLAIEHKDSKFISMLDDKSMLCFYKWNNQFEMDEEKAKKKALCYLKDNNLHISCCNIIHALRIKKFKFIKFLIKEIKCVIDKNVWFCLSIKSCDVTMCTDYIKIDTAINNIIDMSHGFEKLRDSIETCLQYDVTNVIFMFSLHSLSQKLCCICKKMKKKTFYDKNVHEYYIYVELCENTTRVAHRSCLDIIDKKFLQCNACVVSERTVSNTKQETCPICIEHFVDKEYCKKNDKEIVKLINCIHIFHKKCLHNLIDTQSINANTLACPMCRSITFL